MFGIHRCMSSLNQWGMVCVPLHLPGTWEFSLFSSVSAFWSASPASLSLAPVCLWVGIHGVEYLCFMIDDSRRDIFLLYLPETCLTKIYCNCLQCPLGTSVKSVGLARINTSLVMQLSLHLAGICFIL